jgi:hypothetical protein
VFSLFISFSSDGQTIFENKQRIVNELAIIFEKKLIENGIAEEKVKNPWKFKVTYVPRT